MIQKEIRHTSRVVDTMEEDSHIPLLTLLRVNGILETLCPYLGICDWRCLGSASREARMCIQSFLLSRPDAFRSLCSTAPPKVIVFGCHHAHPGNPYRRSIAGPATRMNPCPILQMSLDRIGFDFLDQKLVGNPWSQLHAVNNPPREMGRMEPGVCLVNTGGSKKIFYCGGKQIAKVSAETLSNGDIGNVTSNVTLVFCLRSLTWHRLPNMPEGRHSARLCQVGDKVLVFGGGIEDNWSGAPQFRRDILCFSLSEQRWMGEDEHGIPDLPCSSYSGFALGHAGNTILVAGGEYIFDYHIEYGPLIQGCRETYFLSLSTLQWRRLPDLPETTRGYHCHSSGNVQSPSNDNGNYCFYLSNGDRFFRLDEGADEWEVLPHSATTKKGTSLVQGCYSKIVLGEHGAQFFLEDAGRWVCLPQKDNPPIFPVPGIADIKAPWGIVIDEPVGREHFFTVLLSGQETALAVSDVGDEHQID